jgi:serpin B
MQRRTFLSLLTVPAVAAFLGACGDDSNDGGGGDDGGGSDEHNGSVTGGGRATLRGDAARATGGDPLSAAMAVNAFAADLYARLVAVDPNANLVFSPASIAVALAMTSAGANGTTLAEMDDVLHITDPSTIHSSMNGLTATLDGLDQSRDNTSEGGTGTSEVQLSIANSLWGQSGLAFEQAFLDLLSAEYDAGLEVVDYITDADAARAAINAWVASETRERIPELLAEGTITADARLTLVNAIYLKANWDVAFDSAETTDAVFATPAGPVNVAMMHRTADLDHAGGEGWQAVDLPYVFRGLTMTIAMGDTPDTELPTGDEVFAAFTQRQVDLSLPRFDIETSIDLAEVLAGMGMTTAFTDSADFSGMTTAERLMIGGVIHQANITVDETGTEAAAATAVVMVATGAPAPTEPVTFTVDRPFTFWLRETSTGAIVFIGRVNDPGASRG